VNSESGPTTARKERMKIKDVPQDNGMIGDYGQEVCYAVNENGRYELIHSTGWDPKNMANTKAWDLIFSEVQDVYSKVVQKRLSPLAYHMIKNQMDPGLLSKYVSIAKWRVKRHLKPKVFNGLSHSTLSKYAELFEISVNELKTVPESLNFQEIQIRHKRDQKDQTNHDY